MVTLILSIITFSLGVLIGYYINRTNKNKLVQIGGDNAYQIGIVNNTIDNHDEDDDCAKLPVW